MKELSFQTIVLMVLLLQFTSSSPSSLLSFRKSFRFFVSAFSPSSSLTSFSSRSTFNNDHGRCTFLFQRKDDTQQLYMNTKSDDNTSSSSSSSPISTQDQPTNYQNKNNIADQIVSAISSNGEIKVTACTIRNIINDQLMLQQQLNPTPADALSRAMTCGLLLSNGMQEEQTFQLTLNCDGPIRNVVSVAKSNGEVKGYVGNPKLGDMHISEAIGTGGKNNKGTVQVVKNHPDWPNPYNGITAIIHGDVDRDVGIYLAESEQRSCALAASSKFSGILCVAGGGYVVEQLPFCTQETIEIVEKNLGTLIEKNGREDAVPAGLLNNGYTPYDICSLILDGLDMEPLQNVEPKYVCGCSAERLFRAVRLLPKEEVDKIVEEEEKLEARCHFCGTEYEMSAQEVKERFESATGDPSLDADFQG